MAYGRWGLGGSRSRVTGRTGVRPSRYGLRDWDSGCSGSSGDSGEAYPENPDHPEIPEGSRSSVTGRAGARPSH